MALSFFERMWAQIQEALGDFNRWCAGERLGHPPTDNEALDHYLHNGGPEDFARREQEGLVQVKR